MLQRCLSCLPHCEEERHVDRVSPGSVKDTWIERHGERVRLERRAHSSAGRATKVQLFPGISRAPRKPWKFRRSFRHCQISGVVVGGCRHREDATFQKLESKFTKYDIQYNTIPINPLRISPRFRCPYKIKGCLQVCFRFRISSSTCRAGKKARHHSHHSIIHRRLQGGCLGI